MGYCNQLWAELASEPSHMWADETNGMFHPLPASALAAEVQGRFTPTSANQGRCDLLKYDVSHNASELTKSIQNAPMSSYSRPTGSGLGLSGLLYGSSSDRVRNVLRLVPLYPQMPISSFMNLQNS